MDLVYYLRKHTYRLKYKQNLLRRITTYVYENLKRNMTTFTPDIYCWSGRCSSAPMGETVNSQGAGSAQAPTNPHSNGRIKWMLKTII